MLPSFAYLRAKSRKEAVEQLAQVGSQLHAGGTDLLGRLRDGITTTTRVISIAGLDELRGIEETSDGGLRIGALTTLAEISDHKIVRSHFSVLAEAAAAVGSPQLRNQGTLGGNLCQRPRCAYFRGEFNCAKKGGDLCYAVGGENEHHAIFGGGPCYIVHPSDTAPALIALDAIVSISGPSGDRVLPLESFFILPEEDFERENLLEQGELITAISLPPAAPGLHSSYRKVRERGAWDFALASVALALQMRDDHVVGARVVLGGVAPAPWRAGAAERAITGKILNNESARQAASAAERGAAPLEQNGYKVALVRGIVEESLLASRNTTR